VEGVRAFVEVVYDKVYPDGFGAGREGELVGVPAFSGQTD
jgi:hypothetical protein